MPLLLQQHARDNEREPKTGSSACLSTQRLALDLFASISPVQFTGSNRAASLPSWSEFGLSWSDAGGEMVLSQGINLWI